MKKQKTISLNIFLLFVLFSCSPYPQAHKHIWSNPTYIWADDYSSCTARRVCLIDESHFEEETALSSYEIITPATIEDDGLAKYTCSFENPTFETQIKGITLEKLKYATTPIFSDDNKTVTYGLFPKTHVQDETLIDALDELYWDEEKGPEENGWYFYNGDYYCRHYCNSPFYTGDEKGYFDDGDEINKYYSYWFKCEPIVWNVLDINMEECLLVSSELLYSRNYYVNTSNRNIDGKTIYPSNYRYSGVREWLNEDFYNSAFYLGNDYIKETIVDNSPSSTGSGTNNYACDNTQDRVFLLSYADYNNLNYGFTNLDSRKCKTTDYARATGAYYSKSNGETYNGYHWTRSPTSGYPNYVNYIRSDGDFLFNDNVSVAYRCVRPAIVIEIK